MRKYTIKAFILFFLLALFVSALNGQETNVDNRKVLKSIGDYIFTEVQFGPSYNYSNPVNENIKIGLNCNLRAGFQLIDGKLSIGPQIGFRNFQYTLRDSIKIKNRIEDWNYGLHIGLLLFESENKLVKITNFLEFNHSIFTSYITAQYEGDIGFGHNGTVTDKLNYFTDYPFSLTYGYRVYYDMFYLDIKYNILEKKITLSDKYIEVLEELHIEYEAKPSITFNTLNISIGVSLDKELVKKVNNTDSFFINN